MTKEVKPEPTKAELEAEAVKLAKHDAELTAVIDAKTTERNAIRKSRRAVEGRLTTIRINEKL